MFGLSFLYPLFLIGALAVAIPVALHLFRRKTEAVVDFPAVRLLEKAPVEQQRRRRLREIVLLALRITALALLAFAFARPYLREGAVVAAAPVTAIALDTSLSLSAPGQLERARQAAREAVTNAPATHSVAYLVFADNAHLVVPPTTDRGGVLAAIDQTTLSSGGTRFRTALARAAETITSGVGQIVVVTDLQQAGWEAADEGAVPDGIEISVVEVSPPEGNVAVTNVRRDRSEVIAAVHNYGATQVRTSVRLLVDGKQLGAQSAELSPQAASDIRFTTTLPLRGALEVRVDDAVGYAGDNARFAVLDPAAAVRIFVVSADSPSTSNAGLYLERALQVANEGRAFAPRVVDGRTFSALSTTEFGQPGALIVLGTTTLDRAGRERIATFLRSGGRGLLALGPDIDTATLSDTIGTPIAADDEVVTAARMVTLVAADTRHPIFRPFLSPSGALGDVYVERYRRLNVQDGRNVLARFSDAGDALVEQRVGSGRLLVFASDLDNRWNRFPLNPAFVPWTIEMARYLTEGRGEQQSFTLPDLPAGATAVAGVQSLGERLVAINSDLRESNPARVTVEEFLGNIVRLNQVRSVREHAEAREQEERQRLWQLALAVMFVALAGEGLIGRKAL